MKIFIASALATTAIVLAVGCSTTKTDRYSRASDEPVVATQRENVATTTVTESAPVAAIETPKAEVVAVAPAPVAPAPAPAMTVASEERAPKADRN